jgi:WD40 repeat protein
VEFFWLSGAFCPAGKRFITRNWWNSGDPYDETVLWDVASATPLCVSSEVDSLRELGDIFAFSSDGQRLVNGIHSRQANLIDAATGQTIRSFEGHEGRIVSLAFEPDETTILTGDEQGTAILWDVASGEPLQRFTGHAKKVPKGSPSRLRTRGIGDLAFSPDGTRLLIAGDQGQTTIYAADTGKVLHVLELPVLVCDPIEGIERINVAWSPDGTRIVTAASSGARQWTAPRMLPHGTALWDAETGERLAWIAATPTRFILLGPGGRWAVGPLQRSRGNVMSGVWDLFRSPLPLWNTRTGELVHHFEEYYLCDPARDDGATQHPSTRTSAGVGEISLLRPPRPSLDELWLSPSGRETLAGIADLDEESRAWLGRPDAKWEPPQRAPATRPQLRSPSGQVLLTTDGGTRLWDAKSGEVLKTFEKQISLLRFNPAGTRMVSLSGLKQLLPIGGSFPPTYLWNFETGRPILPPLVVGSAGSVLDGFFSPDGERLITLHETAFAVWTAETGRQLHLHRDETYRFGARTSFPQPFFLADGRRLVTVHENAATVWDTETGTPLHRMDFARTSSPRILHDPDDDWLLTISAGHHAILWDLETGQRRQVFERVPDDFSSVLADAWFGEDRRELFIRHGLGELITVWDVATGAVTRLHYLLNEGRDWLTELPESGEFAGATQWVHWRE